MKKELGVIGLGKMGLGMAQRLEKKGYRVIGYNRGDDRRREAVDKGVEVTESISGLVDLLGAPRVILLAVPHLAVDEVLSELADHLGAGDTVLDGANAYYKNSVRRYEKMKEKGVHFVDVGVSGGPGGALNGACLMVGGDAGVIDRLGPLFSDLSVEGGWRHVGPSGAGHFVKMVHNGIEYGMMQSIAEGFALMKKSDYGLWLTDVADLYGHGSVIESRLVDWLHQGFKQHGEDLEEVTGSVAHSGMGEWTVETAQELEVETPAISSAYTFRINSGDKPSYTGRLLSLMRAMFGGHSM